MSTPRPARLALVAGCVLTACVVALVALVLKEGYEEKIARTQRDLANLSHALAEHVSRTLETVDLSLAAGLDQLRDVSAAAGSTEVHQRVLRAHADALPSVRAIGLYGPDGAMRNFSGAEGELPRSLAGHEILAQHGSGKQQGLNLSLPVRVRVNSEWRLFVSRSMVGPGAELRGVIVASLDPRNLAESYKAIELGADGSVALYTWSGVLLASRPWRDDLIGTSVAGAAASAHSNLELAAAVNPVLNPFTQRPALSAYTPLRGYPLTMSLMADRSAVLGPWRKQALVTGSATALIGILALALGALLDRHIRRREESVARLRENQAELAEAHRIAQLGRFNADTASGTVQWSAQAAQLLGTPSALRTTIDQLLKQVLEQDRQRLRAAWEQLREGHDGDVEFRIAGAADEVRWLRARAEVIPAPQGGGSQARGTLIDITARRESERRRAMEYRIAQLLAQSEPVSRTMPRILETLCRTLIFDEGRQWELDADGGRFRRRCAWATQAPSGAGQSVDGEEAASLNDSSLLAEAWRSAKPIAIDAARENRLGRRPGQAPSNGACVLLIPVTLGSKSIAAIELLAHKQRRIDRELLASAQALGGQIGQYMERRRAEEELRAEKEYIGHVLASAPSLIACIGADGTTRSVNAAIREIAEHAPEDLVGRNFWLTLVCGSDFGQIERLLAQAREASVSDHLMTIVTRSGEPRELSVNIAVRKALNAAKDEYVLVGVDVTARREEEARRAAEHAVARELAAEHAEDVVVPRTLQTVCSTLGWEVGVFRVFDPASGLAQAPHAWSRDEPATRAALKEVVKPCSPAPESHYWRCVQTRAAIWDDDIAAHTDSERSDALFRAGLRAAIAVPVLAGERCLGILQFFSRAVHRPQNLQIETLESVGNQLGQFIERKRVEAAQQQADARLRGIAANIPGVVFEYRLRADNSAEFEYVSERALDVLEESPLALMLNPRLMFERVDVGHRWRLLRSMRESRRQLSLWTCEIPIRTRSGRIKWVRGQSMPKLLEDGTVSWDGVIVDVTTQKQAEQAIQQINEQLERRVTERTAELVVANRELESFAYSVSHDLRAPLRSIDGFSRILIEEHAASLDTSGADHLSRVRNAAQRMGQLIDDLLSLSRVTREELRRSHTDLSAIANGIIEELRAECPDRRADVHIAAGVKCLCDPSLLGIALYNLLGNAWKFTSKRERALIEFGTLQRRGKTVYYVRDNGAGFDMQYAGKLFGAFQRVHSPREFEGTGIGLATVSRIIGRHGGSVWAEAAVDRGATFYFTLGT